MENKIYCTDVVLAVAVESKFFANRAEMLQEYFKSTVVAHMVDVDENVTEFTIESESDEERIKTITLMLDCFKIIGNENSGIKSLNLYDYKK